MTLTPLTQFPNYGTRLVSPPVPAPTTLAHGTTWNSDLMSSGFGGVVATVLSTQIGVLTIQRYADLAGLTPVGAAITQALTANTAAWAGASDGLPFLSFNVTISNTDGALDATLSNVVILTGQPY